MTQPTHTTPADGSPNTSTHHWSHHVMESSDVQDVKEGLFKQQKAHKLAESLKRTAEPSDKHKSSPLRSAMSLLTFYIHRGGVNLSARRKRIVNRAKTELRNLFH